MKPAAILSAIVFTLAGSAEAQNSPPLASARQVFECSSAGCVVSCRTPAGAWVKLDSAINYVYMDTFANGNVRFIFEDGSRGTRTYMLAPADLPCRVDGQR